MGRFMQKRKRNKEYYKIGKKYNFYIGELVMYKNHVQSSMLDKTYLGPARIIELSEKGASIRDTKLDTVLEVGFEHLRKINFEELLTLLPQNFDAEIAETLGTYRYRKVPEGVSDTKTSDTVEDTVYSDTDSTRKTRSGKVFKVKVDTLDKKYAETVKACSVRLLCIPKVVPPMEEKPPIPILKKKCRINHIMSKEEIKNIKYTEEWKEDVLEKIDRYLIRVVPSVLRSEKKCTVEFILNGNKPPGRVKFGKITVHYY
jgi:phosphoribosylformylglycinamidine (FGAM) synthase PurS component